MPNFNGLCVNYVSPSVLVPYKNNPRTHSKKQVKQIADSITVFGFTNPILTDTAGNVIAGHGRLLAAQSLGLAEVPTIALAHMSEAQKRAYVIADNKLAENAGWDDELLKLELGCLLELELDFDLETIGFETGEIDVLLTSEEDAEQFSDLPLPDAPISKPGDLWLLGPHKVFCGDATDPRSFENLLGDERASMVFIDPPYNVPIRGHVSGKGKIKHGEFIMGSSEMSEEEFTLFLKRSFNLLQKHSLDGSLHYICMDWRHIKELIEAASNYTECKNLCVWNKTTGGMGSFYRSQHELVFVYKNGKAAHINNILLGKHGRNRTNVWDFPGVNNFANKDKNDELKMHPTVKPVRMIAEAIQDCSRRNDLILDCFGGSGSTLLAAHESSRRAALIELDPRYVDVIIQRFKRKASITAKHAITGLAFSDGGQQYGG